jgi:hypothetical protein
MHGAHAIDGAGRPQSILLRDGLQVEARPDDDLAAPSLASHRSSP